MRGRAGAAPGRDADGEQPVGLAEHAEQPPHVRGVRAVLTVTSTAFDDGGTIPPRYTCDAEDVQPPLTWDGVPPGTDLTEGAAPPVEGTNDFGAIGYGGPCPPPGDEPHRYVVTVLAVDAPLDLAPGVRRG